MTIVQLEYLLAVVNYGSFSLAAARCFVTQPSLSMQIKALEEELGVVILDRSRKPVMLTQAGEAVVRRAREVLRDVDYLYEDVAELHGVVSGVLRLGVIPTVAPYLLPDVVRDFAARCPDVEMVAQEMTTSEIVQALEHDRLDAAIVAGGTTPDGIAEENLFDDRFYAYVSAGHNLYDRTNVRLEDLDPAELLLLREGHCFRSQVLDFCRGMAEDAVRRFESSSLDSLMRLVDATDCITVIPEMCVASLSVERRAQVKPLARGAASRKIAVAVRRTYVKDAIVRELKESIMACAGPLHVND